MPFLTEKRRKIRLVPAVVFVYDCTRLFFLIAVLAIFLNPDLEFKIINLPMMMFIAPNALFPLMSFFLLIFFRQSRAFIPLYIIGKALCLLCLIVWMFYMLDKISGIREILWAVLLCVADFATIMGAVLQSGERTGETVIPETVIPAITISESAKTEETEGGE